MLTIKTDRKSRGDDRKIFSNLFVLSFSAVSITVIALSVPSPVKVALTHFSDHQYDVAFDKLYKEAIKNHDNVFALKTIKQYFLLNNQLDKAVSVQKSLVGLKPKNIGYIAELEKLLTWQNMGPLSIVFFLSTIIGEMRDRPRCRISGLKQDNEEKERVIRHLNEVLKVRDQERTEYQQRLVNKVDTVRSIYESTKQLNTLSRDDLFDGFQELLANDMSMQKFEIFYN